MAQPFIDPLTLARVKDLPLIAKIVAQGVLHGQHPSWQRGTGIEFSQYRSYEPGDPLNKIDWKLFARSDKYFVREAQRESEMTVWLVLDASQSMQHISEQSQQAGGWNKLDYARHLLATLGYLAQQQGDAVGLFSVSDQQRLFEPARTGKQHWQHLMVKLAKVNCAGRYPDFADLYQQCRQIGKQGMIILVSDFYQHQQEILTSLGHLSNPKTDVLAIQLESSQERDFSYSGQVRFEDMETGQHKLVSANAVRADYLQQRERFNQGLQQQCRDNQIQLFRANIDDPLDHAVSRFLHVRLGKQ